MNTLYKSLMAVLAAGVLAVGGGLTPVVGSPQTPGSPLTPLRKGGTAPGGFRKPPLSEGGVWGGSAATTFDRTPTPGVKSSEEVQFICREGYDLSLEKYVPTTYAWRKKGKTVVIRWVRNDFQQYDPWMRCREVSPRFQKAYKNGSFKYLTNGRINGQPVICTAREEGGDCDTLLFTLLPTDDGLQILADLYAILRSHNVDGPDVLYQNDQRYIEVDIDEFLRTAPVEEEP